MTEYQFAKAFRFAVLLLGACGYAGAQFIPAANSPFSAGAAPVSAAVADFYEEGHLDVAVANQTGGTITLLRGDGTGNFTSVSIPVPGANSASILSAIVTADFNKDGHQDLAIASISDNRVIVLLGDGTGKFKPAPGSPFAVGAGPNSIAVGDFNGDTFPDLAIANINGKSVTVLLGSKTAQFTPAGGSPFAVGNGPSSVTAADFNGDGILDLAVANELDNTVTVLLGKGGGVFSPATASPFAAGSSPGSVAAADFNNDGAMDLIVANLDSNTVTLLLGNGAGGFTPAATSPVSVGTLPSAIAVADFNGDYNADVAVANQNSKNASVLLGNGAGGFKPAAGSPYAAGIAPRDVVVGDFNEDGRPDLLVVNLGDSTVTLLLNTYTTAPAMVSGAAATVTTAAPNSIASIYGTGLSPWPSSAGNPGPAVVTITDASGVKSQPLQLFYTSPTQINALIPPDIATGSATFSVLNPEQPSLPQKGPITINTVAPALFSANATGKGPAIGEFVADFLGNNASIPVFSCTGTPQVCVPAPLSFDASASGSAALVLYGTGIRNRTALSSVTVTINGQALSPFYAGASPGSPGLDQVNVLLPGSLMNSGVVYATVSIGSATSNQVTLLFQQMTSTAQLR